MLFLPFLQRAIIGGIIVALTTSLVGIFVVLRRASFFGDSIAHASLAGVALGLLLGVNPVLTAAAFAVFIALFLPSLQKQSKLPIDSLLGFILPFSMGVGVILLAFLPGYQPELISFLFGSILAISWLDVLLIATLALIVLIFIIRLKQKLVFASFDEEYAKVSGIDVNFLNFLFSTLLALTIVVSIRLVGIILVNALLVIPASTARIYAKSLAQMFVLTPILAVTTIIAGLIVSILLNLPAGPTIAVSAGILFLASVGIKKRIF